MTFEVGDLVMVIQPRLRGVASVSHALESLQDLDRLHIVMPGEAGSHPVVHMRGTYIDHITISLNRYGSVFEIVSKAVK